MYNNPYPYQQPNPYQQQPNPYQPNPYQAPAGMPMAPAGQVPKKSKAPLFIIIAVVAVILIGAIVAIIALGGSSNESGKKEEENNKQEATDPEPEPEVPKPKENTGSDAPNVSFDGFAFKSATNYGDNVRQFAKMGTLYTFVDDYTPLTDINSYLKKTFTYDPEYDEDHPYVTISKNINDYNTGRIVIYSSFVTNDAEFTKKYSELDTFIAVRCGKSGDITVDGKTFKCNQSTVSEATKAFPKGVANGSTEFIVAYGNNFEVDFLFNGDGDTLDTVMIQHFEPGNHYENDKD